MFPLPPRPSHVKLPRVVVDEAVSMKLRGATVRAPTFAVSDGLPMTDDTTTPAPAAPEGRVGPKTPLVPAHIRVAEWAVRSPDRDALRFAGTATSFRALQLGCDRLAAGLAGRGVGQGDRVGLLLRRSPDLVAALLAVLRVGATYVPLDPKLPASRLTGMVIDADVSLIVTDDDSVPNWVAAMPTPPKVARVADLRAERTGPAAEVDFDPDGLAYILFTSGSTGRPKGVEITHANLCCILDAWAEVAGPATADRPAVHLFHSTIAFDASLTEFLWPLTVGRTVAVAPERDSAAGLQDGLGALIESAGVTHVQCTPTRAVLMVADPDDRRSLRGVDHVLVGGEVLSTSLAHELLAAGVGRLTNIYGPTECSIWSLAQPVDRLEGATVPIGRPVAGVRAMVVDTELTPVADGVAGELIIIGDFVGRGYAGRPDLTGERFVQLPVDGRIERCYRTGDLAKRASNDTYTYHGRIDTQVKLRGHRIELGEIEAALSAHASVQQAVVVLHRAEDEHGSDKLVALVVRPAGPSDRGGLPASDDHAWEDDIRRDLGARLPDLMVPSRILAVDSFVHTPSGKVDRTVLDERVRHLLHESATAAGANSAVRANSANADDTSDPLTAMTADLAIVLERPGIGPDDDFFALGGHSLQGVHLLARIRERTGIELPLRVLLDAPTARTLVTVLAHPSGTSAVTPLVRFGPAIANRRLYLVHGAGGNVLGFRGLALALRNDVEIVGIQARGVEPGRPADLTIEAMADRYASAILADDPEGPYDVGGYSDGGTIAIWLAHELGRRGRAVRSVILLDAFRGQPLPSNRLGRMVNVVRNAFDRGGRPLRSWIATSITAWRSREGDGDAVAGRAAALGFVGVDESVEHAVAGATALSRLAAPALLVRSTFHNPVHRLDYGLALGCASHLTTVWIDAPHLKMFEPSSMDALSAAVREFLGPGAATPS